MRPTRSWWSMIGSEPMAKTKFESITAENFDQQWKLMAARRRSAMRGALVRRLVDLPVQIVFFASFLLLSVGIFYEMGGGLIREYIDLVPQAGDLWNRIAAVVYRGAEGEAQRILRSLMLLYLPPSAVALLIWLLVRLLYHPRTPKRTGDGKQDAWQLRAMAVHVRTYAQREEGRSENFFSMLVGVTMAALLLGLMLYANTKPQLQAQVQAESEDANVRMLAYGFALFACYRFLFLPLKWFLRLLHRTRVPEGMVQEAERYDAEFVK